MTNKMNFLWSCCGAAGKTTQIDAPEIDKSCPECNSKMILIDGRGFINSGTHSFIAQCPNCHKKEKFSDYELWKKLWGKCVKNNTKYAKEIKKQMFENCNRLIEEKAREFKLGSFTKRLLQDGIKCNVKPDELLNIISSKTIEEYNNVKLENIQYIYMGRNRVENSRLYFEFIKKEENEFLYNSSNEIDKNSGEMTRDDFIVAKLAKRIDFCEELMKLIYLTGGKINKEDIKKDYYILIKTNDNSIYSFEIKSHTLQYFCHAYFRYYNEIFDEKIEVEDKKRKIDKLKDKFEKSRWLYNHLVDFFDDLDFIYSVLANLNSENRINAFITMLEKNEGWLSHFPMDVVTRYASESSYLAGNPDDKIKPTFVKDLVDSFMEDVTSRKLHTMLLKINNNRKLSEDIVLMLKTKENKEKMIKFLESGETDGDKIAYKAVEIIRNEKGHQK